MGNLRFRRMRIVFRKIGGKLVELSKLKEEGILRRNKRLLVLNVFEKLGNMRIKK